MWTITVRRITFDLEILRGFVAGMELGGFARAAERLGRSTSAVSAQLKKLEEQTGTAIFRKAGRGLALTDAGETMLAYARRLLDLNDEAAAAIQGVALEGWVRLGLQEDFSEALLPDVLGRFTRAHPKVRIEARVARSAELIDRVVSGRLDLALAWSDGALTAHCARIGDVPMCWVGPSDGREIWRASSGEPLPLAVMEAPCLVRTAAANALDRAGIAWRLVFVSPSPAGIWAATAAGLGLTARTPLGLPAGVRALAPGECGLPRLPSLGLVLHRAEVEPAPAVGRLAAIILQAIRDAAPQFCIAPADAAGAMAPVRAA
jgi:DNA-binding transcriptional LysR family regulator